MKRKDALIVGCGLTGASAARVLAEHGYSVRILERRNHIGGNMYDYIDEHGILVHKYGPHTFHTNDKDLFEFISKFSEWNDYKLTCGAEINGICTPTPFNFQTVDDFFPEQRAKIIKRHLLDTFPNRDTVTVVEALESEDEIVREYAQFLFDNDYSLYTAKQWGVSPSKIDTSVLKRVPLRLNYGIGYFNDEYQVMPAESYVRFFESLLDHPNITVELGAEALTLISVKDNSVYFDGKPYEGVFVYTGPLDELFDNQFGGLPYRSIRFEHKYEMIAGKQNMPVVAYPQAELYTRIVEYNKLPVQKTDGTTYVVEYPLQYEPNKEQEPYYPVLTDESNARYQKYKRLAEKVPNLYFCGRLAEFKYYNMDQALKKALETAERILSCS